MKWFAVRVSIEDANGSTYIRDYVRKSKMSKSMFVRFALGDLMMLTEVAVSVWSVTPITAQQVEEIDVQLTD